MKHDVAIIVLNWNNAADTVHCLRSLEAAEHVTDKIIVVDNGSSDDSVNTIRREFPDVFIRETGKNLGYAGGNHAGIRHALEDRADYICILNNDVIVAPDFLSQMLTVAYEDNIGVTTPLVAEMADPEKVWALGSVVNRSTGEVFRLHAGESTTRLRSCPPFEVDVASGAAMLVQRKIFEQVGLLDEAFHLYYEETDWCMHVREQGYRIMAVPSAVVWHKVSATLGQTSPFTDYYMLRNHLRFVARHWRGIARLRLMATIALRNMLTIAAYTIKSHEGRRLPHRNARLLALRDAALGRWGPMRPDVAAACRSDR